MPNIIVVGAQWGDEGKAKVIDYLAKYSDIIIRYQGGSNAGHTVVIDEQKFIFHTIPSGVIHPSKICVIGNGVVFDAEQFLVEIKELEDRNIFLDNRIFISDIAHLVLPYHKILDTSRESNMRDSKIGTTGRGIGPAYSDKAGRFGIRVGDIIDWNNFKAKLEIDFEHKKRLIQDIYGAAFDLTLDQVENKYFDIRSKILPFICDTVEYIFSSLKQGKNLLFEGAQGTLLDIDHGTYPFVTSSNTISGSACTGAGVGPSVINHVVGIVKAYTTRVGNGPFPTELQNETGAMLQKEGSEFGATTGRPRRCGWLDTVALRKAVQLNGFTRIALTKLDVLNKFDEIKICTHYEIDGKKSSHFPSLISDFKKLLPVYESYPGWKTDISGCKKFSDLPSNAIKYIKCIQNLCFDIPILMISVGPERNQTIEIEPLY